jgi:hypothetical protein
MAFQSIAKEDVSKVSEHVQSKDKKALVAALEAKTKAVDTMLLMKTASAPVHAAPAPAPANASEISLVVELVTPMLTLQREAEQLVSQLRDSAFLQPAAARLLATLCQAQKFGKEWSNAGGRAGVAAALVQVAKIADAALQKTSVDALGYLVFQHHKNQSAAAAARAIDVLLQLAKSSEAALQAKYVVALGDFVRQQAHTVACRGRLMQTPPLPPS